MTITPRQRDKLRELLTRVQVEAANALEELADERFDGCALADETVYELDGAVTSLFEHLNDPGAAGGRRSLADRAVWAAS